MNSKFRSLVGLTMLVAGMVVNSPRAADLYLIPPKPLAWKDFLGVNAHLLWFNEAQYSQQLTQLKALGLEWVRIDVHWDRLEPEEKKFVWEPLDGVADALQQQQVKSVVYLVGSAPFASSSILPFGQSDQYPPKDVNVFADRMVALAKRYPVVNAWQVWNEPNLPAFWQPLASPEDYGKLFNASYQALRGNAADKTVVMAGMAYYSQMPLRSGLMLEELAQKIGSPWRGSIIAYHPYSLSPEGDDPSVADFVVRTKTLNARLRATSPLGIWATEWGWSSYDGPKEEQDLIGVDGQADYLLRRLALISAVDFDRVFLFALSDLDERASYRDRYYGLLDRNGNPKPAYTALAKFLAITGPSLNPGSMPKVSSLPKDLATFSVSWMKPDGTQLLMFWARNAGTMELANIKSATLHQPLKQTSKALTVSDGKVSVPVAQQLQILEWR